MGAYSLRIGKNGIPKRWDVAVDLRSDAMAGERVLTVVEHVLFEHRECCTFSQWRSWWVVFGVVD